VQDEGDSLGRGERLEDDEKRKSDRLCEDYLVFGIELARVGDRLGQVRIGGRLGP
jgi:hypothetical protein